MLLYKYFTAEAALRLFRKRMLRFTQPSEFNDPFEMQPFVRGLANEPALETQFNAEFGRSVAPQIDDMLSKLAPEERALINREMINQMVAAQSPQALQAFKDWANLITPIVSATISKGINENLGVLCLTEEPISLLMWAHYADQHRGAVVEFDTTHAFFNRRRGPQDDLRHFRKVEYADQRPHVFLHDSDAVDFFYFKSKEWEYEHEWRLIVPLTDCTRRESPSTGLPVCLFEVPAECLRGVLVGARMPNDQKLQLTIQVRSDGALRHVRVEQIDLDSKLFALTRRQIAANDLDRWVNTLRSSPA